MVVPSLFFSLKIPSHHGGPYTFTPPSKSMIIIAQGRGKEAVLYWTSVLYSIEIKLILTQNILL